MGYVKADEVLPLEIIEIIQEYVEGQNIYIPKKSDNRAAWGEKTQIRDELSARNRAICEEYADGTCVSELAAKYFLSRKSIQRIVREAKRMG